MAAKLQFKFRESASGVKRDELIVELVDNGAVEVSPLFPDTHDRELGSLYTVRVGRDNQVSTILTLLKGSGDVEFAEPEVERRLIMPR